jgi:hypothetical protein
MLRSGLVGCHKKISVPALKYQWKPPAGEWVKLNCDGAYKQSERSGGWGFVIRVADGGVISSGYGVLVNVGEAFHAEICACIHAVQRATDLGIQRVMLATDALWCRPLRLQILIGLRQVVSFGN